MATNNIKNKGQLILLSHRLNQHHQMTCEKEIGEHASFLIIVYAEYDVEVNTPGMV